MKIFDLPIQIKRVLNKFWPLTSRQEDPQISEIKTQLREILEKNIDLSRKNIQSIDALKKQDLDSVELFLLLSHIEAKWGSLELSEVYQCNDFDEIARLIARRPRS